MKAWLRVSGNWLFAFIKRVLRTGKALARDERIPRWLRWLFLFGVAPVPLFLDEVALVLAVLILAVAHRALLIEAWRLSERSQSDGQG